MDVILAVLAFIDIVALTFVNGYWLITLDELELDHLNPADVSKRLNKLVFPEMILHAVLMLLCLVAWAPWVFLLNLPIAIWHARRVMRNEHLLDPTEILRFKNLQAARTEAIAKTVFYGFQIVYGMFCQTQMRRRLDRRRAAAKAKANATATAATDAEAASGGPSAAAASSVPTGAATAAPNARKRPTTAATLHPAGQFKLHLHGHEFQNGEELVLNPDCFPELKEMVWSDYVVEIFHATDDLEEQQRDSDDLRPETASPALNAPPRQHLLLEIPQSSATPVRGRVQVSVLKDTAAVFQLAPFKDVMVRFLAKSQVEVDFVEVSLKDQFLSRRDLWYLQRSLVGTALHVGKHIRVQGTRWQVMDIRSGGDSVHSGVISTKTKFAFRSRTSRVVWLVQVSPEMWDMANSGRLYMEILLSVVQSVLNKWIKHKVSHSLTIIFFARNYYPQMDYDLLLSRSARSVRASSTTAANGSGRLPQKSKRGSNATNELESTFPYGREDYFPIGVDEEGRHYQDFYKTVAFDSPVIDVQPWLVKLKKEMNEFPHLCGWQSPAVMFGTSPRSSMTGSEGLPSSGPSASGGAAVQRKGVPSNARDGNLLEAINLMLNIFEKHHIDRHLARSGQSVVIMTAGNGIFSVNKRLSEITEQRMMDHGIGIDLISLSTPPLHKCPLFLFKRSDITEMKLPSRTVDGAAAADGVCVCTPQMLTKAPGFQRRARTASTDGIFDSQSVVGDQVVSSIRSHQLCKHCTQRLEDRKSYVVPLWTPLCFVQEQMMMTHNCPLDEDITTSCPVCHPLVAENKDFESLPMCRMFRRQDTSASSLPKPLERLLNQFQPMEDLNLYSNSSSMANLLREESTTYEDLLYESLDSDLVRARAASIASADDAIGMGNGVIMGKPRPGTLADEFFDSYDEEVFGFNGVRKLLPKSSDGDISGRTCLTPPLKPEYPGSGSKKRAVTATIVAFQSNSFGDGNGNGNNNTGGRGKSKRDRWRQFEANTPPVDSGGIEADNKFVSSDDDSGSVHEFDLNSKPRALGGSLPTAYQLDGSDFSHAPYTNSPALLPADVVGKEDLFHSQSNIFKQLTSNQRRWTQVRPDEKTHQLVQNKLKWKSLCFPALLPLSIDYLPTPKELQAHYTESFYSVTLPERDEQSGVAFRDYRELVMEMVAQRFSQDFQLVISEDQTNDIEKSGTVFHLSMGHRIHEIMYNEETQTIDVKRYLQRATARSDTDIMEYRYTLWSPVTDTFRSASQEFRKYPRIEYQWNYLDQLICGYYDEMSEGIRPKRIMHCVVPPTLDGTPKDRENLQLYTDRCRKFLEFLRSKAGDSGDFPHVSIPNSWQENIPTHGVEAFSRVRQENVKIPLHASDSPTSQNWVIVKLDTELRGAQCFHVEFQWLVCRSSLVEDFITGIVRRAKQLGLEFIQVRENGISSNLDLHPLVSPIFLPLRDPVEQNIVEEALVNRFSFCGEALRPIPFTHLNHHEEYEIIHQEPRGRGRRVISYYRQYVHRTMPCCVRVTQTGLVWVSNQQWHTQETQTLFQALEKTVESVHMAHSALYDVLNGVLAKLSTTPVAAEKKSSQPSEQVPKKDSGANGHETAELTDPETP